MMHRVLIVLALTAAAPLAATAAADKPAVEQPASIAPSLGERGLYGLLLGAAVFGLALRRRRRGPVVTQ